MILFAHLGLTTGAVKLYEGKRSRLPKLNSEKSHIDYRFVLIGSILPDLIDKPLGVFLFRNTFNNSRIFAHTLLFSAVLMAAGLIQIRKRGHNTIFTLGVCCLIHLVLDSMWLFPKTLFWPFINIGSALSAGTVRFKTLVAFPAKDESDWLRTSLSFFLRNPLYIISEIAGFLILAHYFRGMIRRKELGEFFRKGKL